MQVYLHIFPFVFVGNKKKEINSNNQFKFPSVLVLRDISSLIPL